MTLKEIQAAIRTEDCCYSEKEARKLYTEGIDYGRLSIAKWLNIKDWTIEEGIDVYDINDWELDSPSVVEDYCGYCFEFIKPVRYCGRCPLDAKCLISLHNNGIQAQINHIVNHYITEDKFKSLTQEEQAEVLDCISCY